MKLLTKLRLIPDLPRLLVSHLNDLEHRQESRLNRMVDLVQRQPPAFATLLVIGKAYGSYSDKKGVGEPFMTSWAASQRVAEGRNATMVKVAPMRPLEACTAVVLADLERVEVQGLFVGLDCITLGAPVGFFELVTPGQEVRAMLLRRE